MTLRFRALPAAKDISEEWYDILEAEALIFGYGNGATKRYVELVRGAVENGV